MFKVSETEWVKKGGFSVAGHKKLAALKHPVVWKQGGGWSIYDELQDKHWGFAKVKNDKVTPDHLFAVKYEELTGSPLIQIGADMTVGNIAATEDGISVGAALDAILKVAEASATAKVPTKTKAKTPAYGQNLTTVDDVGVIVKGTSAMYMVYMISDDANIAYRYAGDGLSIRLEKFTPKAKAVMAAWGVETGKVADDGRPYASIHVQVPSIEIVRRTLGSLAMTILTGPPKKLLANNDVKVVQA